MNKIRLLAAVVLAGLLVAVPAAAQTPTPPTTGTPAAAAAPPTLPAATGQPSPQYVSMMLGCAEAPPVSTLAEGAATFQLSSDGTTMNYAVWAFNIQNVTEAHIHMGPPNTAGPIAVWLYPSPSQQSPKTISGLFNGLLMTGSFTSSDFVGPMAGKSMSDLVAQMQSGNTYANTHTTASPGGEVSGQIVSTTALTTAPSGTGTPAATAVAGAAGTPTVVPPATAAASAAATPVATGTPATPAGPSIPGY